ncbi:NAD(P)/FAD-dependent oxidoreductase [Nocardia harenae]|uniref:NAD(P)/FAD-dependent oxidoreductase n=1 Tax=Nocardia harenae TaxID=358707 RepID=UPI0009FEB816|nr:NAD(P)/FAD-dependent oxidoreductase [Nocardia harenae]
MTERYDVVIVGGRCAGSALATLLAGRGLRVLVLEQAKVLRNTLSSHILQTDAVTFLDRIGLTERIMATGAPLMTRVDSRMDDFHAIIDYPLEPGDVGGALAVRRDVLDPLLADASIAAGAEVRSGAKVTGLVHDADGRVAGVRVLHGGAEQTVLASLVVGADGRRSTIAELCGARRYNVTENERWYYFTYFENTRWDEPTFVFHRWGDRHVFAGPTDNGRYIVGVSPEHHEREQFRADLHASVLAHAVSCAPVARALTDARQVDKIYGITGFEGYFREPAGPGWILIGDAGHFKDPAVGRGIADAFAQAQHVAEVIGAHLGNGTDRLDRALAAWGRARDRRYADYYWMATDIGCAGPVPAVYPAMLRQLERRRRSDDYLRLYSHRRSPTQLMHPRYLGAAVIALLRAPGPRAVVGAELMAAVGREIRRRYRSIRPVFATAADAAEPVPQIGAAAR